MPKYTPDEVRKAMDQTDMIRNFCFVGGQQHGKTTVIDCLGAQVGYLASDKIGEARFMNAGRADEKEKGVTLKANTTAMIYNSKYNPKDDKGKVNTEEEKEGNFLLNLVDCPGHMEYSPEVAAATRMSDGFVVVCDVTSGINVLTEYTINDCLKERLKPALFINTLDKAIMVMEKSGEEIYQECSKIVTAVNIELLNGEKVGMKGLEVSPSEGSVIIGSALYGWAFSLDTFAKLYAAKFKQEVSKFMPRLWGDQFFNPAKKSWTKTEVDGSIRGFCQFVMNPILQLHTATLGGDMAKVEKMCTTLGVDFTADDKKLEGKALLRRVMSKWLPAADATAKMVATHLPGPLEAQKYRMELIYQGEMDTDIAKAMLECKADGPVMMQVCRLSPTGSAGRFYGIGRLFSGTLTPDKYIVRGPEYDPEDPETAGFSQDGRLQSVGVYFGKDYQALGSAPCGSILAVNGVDQYMVKTATVTNKKAAGSFKAFKFNVSPVLKVAIRPADPKQLPKLVEGLKRLLKSDMLVQTKSEPTGDHIIMGCGDEHLKTLLKDLKNEHACIDFTQGVPTVSYKETITGDTLLNGTEKDALSKSPNKHNRLYVKAQPIDEELCKAIEEYKVNAQQDVKKRARIMIDEYGWEKTDCMKIWGFGPADIGEGGANILVDQTKGIQYMNEIKESVKSGLLWATREGPLAEENMRGCRFNLMDCKLHADSIHRGMGQIQPTARRVFYAALLMSEPRFMEPFFRVTIACPESAVAGVSQAIAAKRGELIEQKETDGKQIVDCYLPIAETIGDEPFSKKLQMNTSGKAFATYVPDHWEHIDANPLTKGSKAEGIMFAIRERKGLKVEQPVLYDYLDKL